MAQKRMSLIDPLRRSGPQRRSGRGGLLLSAAVLLASIGCESGFGGRPKSDPFFGTNTPPAPVPAPSAPSNAPAVASSGPIPPLPATYTGPGTVPMAGGETATTEDPRSLRMTGDPFTPASNPGTGAVRGTAPGVTVGNPEPAQGGAISNLANPPSFGTLGAPTPSPAAPSTSATNIRTYEDAQNYLKQHGVNWQRLSGDEGEWKFSCGIPNASNSHVSKTYSTKRAFPDSLSAIRAVIAEIEQTPR